ncbi:MAG: hypothetical protein WAV83_07705 [Methanothrix sp.]|uniref:hypothetical protein n=1 Tax=Methanothrix sp. TaxID=90426 RepID=UPI0032B00545
MPLTSIMPPVALQSTLAADYPAQALASLDNGPGMAGCPICQPLIQGFSPKKLGIPMALNGLPQGLSPLVMIMRG